MNGSKKIVPMKELEPVISELLNDGDNAEFTMTGDSMLPFLHGRRDVVVLEGISDRDKIKKLDILFYRRPNGVFVLHRVVRVCKDGTFTMCGDAQYALEQGLTYDLVIGRLKGFYSYKKPAKFISCDGKFYRLKSALWVLTREIRYFFFKVKRKLKSLL